MARFRIVAVVPVLNDEAHAAGIAKWRSGDLGWAQAKYGDVISDAHHDITKLRAAGVVLEEVTE